ncbi:MAG TPA: type II toxin-antitoxin system VapC family toxin [Jatrophihabitantaceae bacterium]|nr:type II toxin-antitoxin system VapC family toxin [Jatrophihabitantaceae bacterium]
MGEPVKAVLDTSVVIAGDVAPQDVEVALSVITFAELHLGVLAAKDDLTRAVRLARLSAVQQAFAALPVDDDVARSYGQLAAAVGRRQPNPRTRASDLLIAATAHAHGARLYTCNAGDLRGLDDLVQIVAV